MGNADFAGRTGREEIGEGTLPPGHPVAPVYDRRTRLSKNLPPSTDKMPVSPAARMAVLRRHTKVSLRGVIFREIRQVRISITNYLDVMSSWCFWRSEERRVGKE